MLTSRTQTPWGVPDRITWLVPGVAFVSTPGHGGFWLDSGRRKIMRDKFNGLAPNKAYYEEDCEAALVLLAFFDELGDARHSLQEVTRWAQRWFNVDGTSKALDISGPNCRNMPF